MSFKLFGSLITWLPLKVAKTSRRGSQLRGIVTPALVIGIVFAASLPTAAGASGKRTTAVPAPIKITVSMGEFYFKFSKQSVVIPKTGSTKTVTVVFTIVNKGQIAHDLAFSSISKQTPLLQPGAKQTLKITFKKKGRYPYLCTVPRHANAGMAGVFVVK